MKSHKPISIAIVGGGAAGASVAHYLVQLFKNRSISIQIKVYEKRGVIGPGLAYQRDNDVLLMNMVSRDASLFSDEPENFWRWLARADHKQYKQYVLAGSAMSPEGYVPRGLFGCYLRQMFEQVEVDADQSGVELSKHYAEIVGVQKIGNQFELMTATGENASFDYVILCTGNTKPVDYYSLSGHARYINDPYPVPSYLGQIAPTDRVAIIGTQLTAADVAIALAHHGHQGQISMVSRSAELPSIRSLLKPYQLQYVTVKNLESMLEKGNGSITLLDALRLLRKEFKAVGADWREVLFKTEKMDNPQHYFEGALNRSLNVQPWQWVMVAIDHVIEYFWNALAESEKLKFMKKYHRHWNSRRAPLPVTTAYKLYLLMKDGHLNFRPGIQNIRMTEQGVFHADFIKPGAKVEDGAHTEQFDWIINATGPSRDIDEELENNIAADLLNAGNAVKNPHGGLIVDFNSSAVMNGEGEIDRNLYVIGQLACGTYYFVSSLEMISMRARKVAYSLVQHIDEHSYQVTDAYVQALAGIPNVVRTSTYPAPI
jgi:uncharacterized NAD(P)/FAD-binding protein YdhS